MRSTAFILAVLAIGVMASTAAAGSKWTDCSDSGSDSGNACVDVNRVWGTWTREYSFRWYDNGSSCQANGQCRQSFVSDDGTVTGKGIDNFFHRRNSDSATNGTSTGHFNSVDDGGLIARTKYVSHFTFNASGELTSDICRHDNQPGRRTVEHREGGSPPPSRDSRAPRWPAILA